jgi:hypothetical protein
VCARECVCVRAASTSSFELVLHLFSFILFENYKGSADKSLKKTDIQTSNP